MRIGFAAIVVAALLSAGCASDHRRGSALFPFGIYAAHFQPAHSHEFGGVQSLMEHVAEGGFWEGQAYSEHFAPEPVGGLPAIWGGTVDLFTSSDDRVALAAYGFHLR